VYVGPLPEGGRKWKAASLIEGTGWEREVHERVRKHWDREGKAERANKLCYRNKIRYESRKTGQKKKSQSSQKRGKRSTFFWAKDFGGTKEESIHARALFGGGGNLLLLSGEGKGGEGFHGKIGGRPSALNETE